VAISPDELPGVLAELRDRVARSAPPVAMETGEMYRRRVSRVTLRRYSHSYGTSTDSPPGQPPAWVLGALARSVTAVMGAASGITATVRVAPHTIYARIQELGGVVTARRARYLRFSQNGNVIYSRRVELPPRPYMRPTTEDCIEDGSFTRTAAETFEAEVWG
jgi:hypothetical protein